MSDELVRRLARKAGIDPVWRDQKGAEHVVPVGTLRALLAATGLPAANDDDLHNGLSLVELGQGAAPGGGLISARVDQQLVLPAAGVQGGLVEIEMENGGVRSLTALAVRDGLMTLPPIEEPGYHRIRMADREHVIAVAPRRAVVTPDLTGGAASWGLAAQIYSLRRPGDGGVGDFSSVAALGRAAARRGADALAISPVHALFSAEPRHFSPYSPSSRLFYNPVHADPAIVMPEDLVREALEAEEAGGQHADLEHADLIDWPRTSRRRQAILRRLHRRMADAACAQSPFRLDYERFRAEAPAMLLDHAIFEALHADQLARPEPRWSWRDWTPELRQPESRAVRDFAAAHAEEVDFHLFAQWLTGRSFADCQRQCREAGMRIGLIADLAIGMDGTGSHAWSRQNEVLDGASIGAPPDYYNADGQDWGLTGFSPRGLAMAGFAPFIETLRASMRYAGGIRIDHVMGMSRLWLVPKGAKATEGAYLNYPAETLFRLAALESWRHKAVVIGEDLGTLPTGFRDHLREQGVAGMRVLRFEKDDNGYRAPESWEPSAVAMTTTHDLIATAGWWAGADIEARQTQAHSTRQEEENIRAWDRGQLWAAFERSGLVEGERPALDQPEAVVDAAVSFLALTPCACRLLAVEDAIGTRHQPNVPGTTIERPNWRHRLAGPAENLLDDERTMARLRSLGGHDPETDHAAEGEAPAA